MLPETDPGVAISRFATGIVLATSDSRALQTNSRKPELFLVCRLYSFLPVNRTAGHRDLLRLPGLMNQHPQVKMVRLPSNPLLGHCLSDGDFSFRLAASWSIGEMCRDMQDLQRTFFFFCGSRQPAAWESLFTSRSAFLPPAARVCELTSPIDLDIWLDCFFPMT
ncbi:hypothetical protein LX36DRAFT_407117 [Colletotrichum falcatum]|nr:hypothetical protein LX36DRAFT_407117 [Colletotrichum falcatum]